MLAYFDIEKLPQNTRDYILTDVEIFKTCDKSMWSRDRFVQHENCWDAWRELSDEQREKIIAWCIIAFRQDYRRPMKRVDASSYGLKHRFEESSGGFYLSNGQFKVAMAIAGFKPDDPRKLNWTWNRLWYSTDWKFELGSYPKWEGEVRA